MVDSSTVTTIIAAAAAATITTTTIPPPPITTITTTVQFPTERDLSLLLCIHIGSGAHPASYPVGTSGSFPRSKVARV
jgi:hypothetical protein